MSHKRNSDTFTLYVRPPILVSFLHPSFSLYFICKVDLIMRGTSKSFGRKMKRSSRLANKKYKLAYVGLLVAHSIVSCPLLSQHTYKQNCNCITQCQTHDYSFNHAKLINKWRTRLSNMRKHVIDIYGNNFIQLYRCLSVYTSLPTHVRASLCLFLFLSFCLVVDLILIPRRFCPPLRLCKGSVV